MKSAAIYGTVAMVALSAQLVLAAKTNPELGNFTSAVQMLNMGTNETYADAVNKLYSNQSVSFDALLLLAKSTRNSEEKNLIYDAIRKRIRANNTNDLQKLDQLRGSIRQEMLHHQASDGAGFNKLILNFQRIIHDEAIGYLKLRNFTYASIVLELGDDDTYESVVREMYEKSTENVDLLIDFGDYMLHWTPQVSKFYQALYKVMRTNGRNDTNEKFKLIETLQAGIPLAYADRAHLGGVITVLNHILYDDLIDLIQSRKFDLAEQKLVNCSDDAYIFVIKEIYDQPPNNSDVVLHLENFTHDIAVKSKIYDALINTVIKNTNPDRFNHLLRLYSLAKSEYYHSAGYIFDGLKSEILDQVVEPISSSFIENVTSEKAQQLSYEISKADIELLYSVYSAVVEKISRNFTTTEILKRQSYCLHQLIERMAMDEAIIHNLESTDRLQKPTDEILALAYNMKQVLNESLAYGDISEYWRSRYEGLKNKLPFVTRIIAFSKVCLKNNRLMNTNNYIYATERMYDNTRRYIYVDPLGKENLTAFHKWRVLRKPGGFCFENDKFGEYMFSDDNAFYQDNKRQRMVFTGSKNISSHCNWSLKWYGKSIRIVDSQGGYLFPTLTDGCAYVAADPNQSGLIISQWEVVDCS